MSPPDTPLPEPARAVEELTEAGAAIIQVTPAFHTASDDADPMLKRAIAKTIANAAFAARQGWLWGEGTTAVASDSTHFSAFDQNIFTEYHSRYKRAKRGVLIYWTVETSGAMLHETNMNVETNYVDSHGATLIGFGITRLLNFDLIARFKQINVMKLYLPGRGDRFAYPLLRPALTRPIRPELIENNYDMMIRYATAIRQGTASTEALLRRFQGETTHPAYSAKRPSRG